jgi:glycosyltransferase involved in cell wall biosynthesis
MQDHTAALTRVLTGHGIVQVVLTTRPPTAPWTQELGAKANVLRVGLPVPRARQLYAVPASALAPVLARRADLVHAHLGEDLAVVPLAVAAARRRRLPLVITVHCSLAHTLRVTDVRTAVQTLGAMIERWGERRAAATLVLTSRLADMLARDAGLRRVHVIPRGVDRRAFAALGPDPFPHITGRPRVVFLGRLARSKGVERLVLAASLLKTPGVQLLLVGDGPERPRAERLARALGIAERVHVTGFVPHDGVPAVLASADLLVLPSLYEELGTVLIEAMQLGLPSVASCVGGISELLRHGELGMLVRPGDPVALAAGIDAVLSDPELARRLGAAALRRAPEYDWDRVGAQIRDLYRRVVERGDGRPPAHRPGSPADRLARRFWPA